MKSTMSSYVYNSIVCPRVEKSSSLNRKVPLSTGVDGSDVEPEKHDVPVADLVVLSLKPHLPGIPYHLLGALPHVILVGYGLGPYEALSKSV